MNIGILQPNERRDNTMNRWSFIKRFGRSITFDDFMRLAKQFCLAIDFCYESPSIVKVRFYEKLPHSITTIQPGLNKWLAEENKRKQLTEVTGLENVTGELFDRAVNVQLDIRPSNDAKAPLYTFGHLKCKGLLNRHLVYYIQPEKVGEVVKTLCLGQLKLSDLLAFDVGDGYEHCH